VELNFSKGDLLQGQPITPGFYKGSIIKEELLTRDGVIDYKITLNFDDEALSADERFVEHTFFTCLGKGRGFLIPYMAALLNKNTKEITDGMDKGQTFGFSFGEGQNVGKKVQFQVTNEQYQGRIQNRVATFIPYLAEVPIGA
jgi:hypothetical protein